MFTNSYFDKLRDPGTLIGRRYFALLTATVISSILILFIDHEFPQALPLGSLQLWLIELFMLAVFSADIILQISRPGKFSRKDVIRIIMEILATLPSLLVVLQPLGLIDSMTLDLLVLLRLFRLLRLVRLLRVGQTLTVVFGTSVLTLVFGTMAIHLSLRVLILELSTLAGIDIYSYLDTTSMGIAVTAVGAVFGIALAITFGIVKRKQLEITELHREALDTIAAFERDIKNLNDGKTHIDFKAWHDDLELFLSEQLSYPEIKLKTNQLLAEIRQETISRPSMDVPFHRGLVPCLSAFLTKTQLEFHPAFYRWLNRIANLYFTLTLFAAAGLTGMVVQMLVIYVFQGLVVVIDDMDHAVDTQVVIFNAKILNV